MCAQESECHFEGGPILADKFLPKLVPHGGLILARGDHFGSQNRSGRTNFGSKSGPGGPVLADFSAKISPAGPILGGTDFGGTAQKDQCKRHGLFQNTTMAS